MSYGPNELDARIMRAISEFEGVPSASALSEKVGVDTHVIIKRTEENLVIAERMEERGKAWLENVGDAEFLHMFSTKKLISLPKYARELVDAKIGGMILGEIDRFEGVPTNNALNARMKISYGAIYKNIMENPLIRNRMEIKGRDWLAGLDEREFLEKYSEKGWLSGIPKYAKALVNERVDRMLLNEINGIEGIPTQRALGRLIGIASVGNRIKANPKISEEMEKRGKAWLENAGDAEFLRRYSRGDWANPPEYARELIYARINGLIFGEIERFEGKPSFSELGGKVGIGSASVRRSIEANEKLWLAYHAKRGLTPDQAVELALERGENSEGFRKALNERLRNLSAMREMIGIIRCFSDLMQKAVSCISLYPDPLAKAAEEIGEIMESSYVDMAPLRKGKDAGIPGCGTLVVHGLHRLPEEGINALFAEVRTLYAEHPELSIIATHSAKYVASEGFLEALGRCGFSLEDSGTILMGAPDEETLESYGVPKEDVWRVRRKVSGEFGVMELKMEAECGAARIPCLGKAPSGNGDSIILPEAEAIDVPTGVGKELIARFLPDAVVVSPEPFMVEIMDGGKPCALVGFDMNPGKKNAVEAVPYPNSPSENYRGIARRLATQLGLRRKLGVKPNSIERVQLSACREGKSTQ